MSATEAKVFAVAFTALALIVGANLHRAYKTGRIEYGHVGARGLFADRVRNASGYTTAVCLNVFCLVAFIVGIVQSISALTR